MRPAILTSLNAETFTQQVQIGPHQLMSDVAPADGGADAGPSPHEYLAAALASCTAITLRMYAKRKGWDLQALEVQVDITHSDGVATFDRRIRAPATLGEEQRGRLVAIANACPVHKTLSGTLRIETRLG